MEKSRLAKTWMVVVCFLFCLLQILSCCVLKSNRNNKLYKYLLIKVLSISAASVEVGECFEQIILTSTSRSSQPFWALPVCMDITLSRSDPCSSKIPHHHFQVSRDGSCGNHISYYLAKSSVWPQYYIIMLPSSHITSSYSWSLSIILALSQHLPFTQDAIKRWCIQ